MKTPSIPIGCLLLLLLALVSCQASPAPVAQPTLPTAQTTPPPAPTTPEQGNFSSTVTGMPQVTPNHPSTSSPTAGVSPSQTPPLLSPTPRPTLRTLYSLSAKFDYTLHFLTVNEQIEYTNNSPEALPEILLVIEPAQLEGVFSLKSLDWTGGQAVIGYAWDGRKLSIPLSQPLEPGQEASLSISYELHVPAIPPPSELYRPVVFGYSDRQVNLVDWYPYIPPYRPGEGWLVHDPWYFGEHQVYDAADFQVEVELANPPPGLVLAASASPEQEGGNVFHYNLLAARNFAFSASPEYQAATAISGGVTITSYSFPWDQAGGEAALRDTAAAVELYGRLFGAYPHTSLSVVEADFLDGMEFDGLYFLSRGFYNLYDGTPKGYLTAIAVHETAHQWWYGLVGDDQALEPWLDEALSTYCEYLFYQNVYPELGDWWWGYRVNYYQPSGYVDDPIYAFKGFTLYRNAVYLNGARFLQALRQQIGDEDFFAFFKDYAARYAQKQATGEEFFALLATHTSTDLSSLLQTYFDPAGTNFIQPAQP